MTRQGEKKKKEDNDKLKRMLGDVFTFLEKQSHPCGPMKNSNHFVISTATSHHIRIFPLPSVHGMMYPWH
jgi:hypothetical protein